MNDLYLDSRTSVAYSRATSIADFEHNLAAVRARIAAACRISGRDPGDVRLLTVSKTVDEARVRMAYAEGCRWLGENNAP